MNRDRREGQDKDRERGKKSWRDIDAMRDRARPTPAASSGPPRPQREEDRASKQHRAALEALFARGEVGKLAEKMAQPGPRPDLARLAEKLSPSAAAPPVPPAAGAPAAPPAPAAPAAPARASVAAAPTAENTRIALRKKILEAVGRDQISRAVDKFVEAHGLPSDFEVLEQALEHNREERVEAAMAALEKLLEKEKPKRSRALLGKLRFIEETSHNTDLRAQAARIRGRLG